MATGNGPTWSTIFIGQVPRSQRRFQHGKPKPSSFDQVFCVATNVQNIARVFCGFTGMVPGQLEPFDLEKSSVGKSVACNHKRLVRSACVLHAKDLPESRKLRFPKSKRIRIATSRGRSSRAGTETGTGTGTGNKNRPWEQEGQKKRKQKNETGADKATGHQQLPALLPLRVRTA